MGQLDTRFISSKLREADMGAAEALYDLGLLYSVGQGVEQNNVEAHKWFNLAAIRGLKSAQIDRAEVAEYMTPQEIAEAQKQAREWLSTH